MAIASRVASTIDQTGQAPNERAAYSLAWVDKIRAVQDPLLFCYKRSKH